LRFQREIGDACVLRCLSVTTGEQRAFVAANIRLLAGSTAPPLKQWRGGENGVRQNEIERHTESGNERSKGLRLG